MKVVALQNRLKRLCNTIVKKLTVERSDYRILSMEQKKRSMTDADKWVLKGLAIFLGLVIGPYVFLAFFLIFCFF